MPSLKVSQVRSGEGAILTRFSRLGPERLPDLLPDAFTGVLLVASEAFEKRTPPGGEQMEAHLFAFMGESAKAMLRDHAWWGPHLGVFAIVDALPNEDVRRRCISHATRPWDPERMKARVYGQLGRQFAHAGTWFLREDDRRLLVESAFTPVLAEAGHRLPNGDITIVLELPADATYEAEFSWRGKGADFRLRREMLDRGIVRDWSVERGEWRARERRTRARHGQDLRSRAVAWAATAGIFLLALPAFLMAGFVVAAVRLGGGSSTIGRPSTRTPPR